MDPRIDQIWSNKKCIEIAYRNNFPSIVKDINVQKAIISRFLNFYLSGKIQKGLSIIDLIFAVISIMPVSADYAEEEYIWKDCHYSDDGTLFFLSPEDKLQYDIKMLTINQNLKKEESTLKENLKQCNDSIINIPESTIMDSPVQQDKQIHASHLEKDQAKNNDELNKNDKKSGECDDNKEDLDVKFESNERDLSGFDDNELKFDEYCKIRKKSSEIQWYRLKRSNPLTTTKVIQYGAVENAKFCITCNKLLSKWEKLEARLKLKYFFGVTALVLMRARTKPVHNLEAYFLSKFTNLFNFHISYSPPHKSCITKTWKMFRKLSTPDIHTMFAKLVINSFYIEKFRYEPSHVFNININIFKASVLAHTSNYGMGLINMLQVIALHTHDMFYSAFECMRSDETSESWEHVKNYINEYLSNKNEHTHHWARLIDPEQFQNLCCTNNYKLAVVIAVFIENLTNSEGIWNSSWTKNKTYDLVHLKNHGTELYNKYKKKKLPLKLMFDVLVT